MGEGVVEVVGCEVGGSVGDIVGEGDGASVVGAGVEGICVGEWDGRRGGGGRGLTSDGMVNDGREHSSGSSNALSMTGRVNSIIIELFTLVKDVIVIMLTSFTSQKN